LIQKYTDEIKLNLTTFAHEKEELSYIIDDLHRENSTLKSENDQLLGLGRENDFLTREIRNLKDLLLESSIEM
jgi:cell division protein FtsB